MFRATEVELLDELDDVEELDELEELELVLEVLVEEELEEGVEEELEEEEKRKKNLWNIVRKDKRKSESLHAVDILLVEVHLKSLR